MHTYLNRQKDHANLYLMYMYVMYDRSNIREIHHISIEIDTRHYNLSVPLFFYLKKTPNNSIIFSGVANLS